MVVQEPICFMVTTAHISRLVSVFEYHSCFLLMLTFSRYDSIVNTYLIEECGLHPPTSSQYGLVVHSHGDFFGSIAFPAVADLGLRVSKLGKSSVTYEIALFERGVEEVKSIGEIVHVFVDRETGRPATNGLSNSLKEGLQKLLVPNSKL
jgi:acyl-CoA thioester hydrolase